MPSSDGNVITRPLQELLGQQFGYGFAGLSVSTATGNYTAYVVDLGFPAAMLGLLDFTRTYNAFGESANPLGRGWATAFSAQLSPAHEGPLHSTPGNVQFTDEDGRVLIFRHLADGTYQRPQDLAADLTQYSGGFTLSFYQTGETWAFDTGGQLTGRSAEGKQLTFDRDGEGRLLRATHSAGPQLNFSYDDEGRLTLVAADDGRTVAYGYGPSGTLSTVTGPLGETTGYEWTPEGWISRLRRQRRPGHRVHPDPARIAAPGRRVQMRRPPVAWMF